MDKVAVARTVCLSILDYPLKVVASDKRSLLAKFISGIAIAALSVLSLGYYAYRAYQFFAHKKVAHLQKELETAIGAQDCDRVRELFKNYPILKTEKEIKNEFAEDSHISRMLPLAAETGCLEMVELLCDSGATLEAYSRGMKTALERALENDQEDVAYYLLDKGARVTQDELVRYISQDSSNLNMILCLAEKIGDIQPLTIFSLLGLVSTKYNTDSDKCKEVMALLIKKGDRLNPKDVAQFKISTDVQQFIDDQVKLVA